MHRFEPKWNRFEPFCDLGLFLAAFKTDPPFIFGGLPFRARRGRRLPHFFKNQKRAPTASKHGGALKSRSATVKISEEARVVPQMVPAAR
jgi:hypothetical protein